MRAGIRRAAVIVAGLSIGAGVAFATRGGDQPSRAHHPPSVTRFSFTEGALPPVTSTSSGEAVAAPAEEPASAEAALHSFLSAVTEARPASAYALLDEPSRRRFPTAASWTRRQADLASPIAFAMGPSRAAFASDGEVVEFEVTASHRPSLDAIRGLVPGRSKALWQVRREPGGWRVGAQPVSVTPVLPPDTDAPDTVRAWVKHLQTCERPGSSDLQVGSYLYGPAELVGAPCAKPGAWTVGGALALDRATDANDFVAAFGPGVGGWARAVPVDGPGSRFLAVVAPLGDAWRVIGVAVPG